MPLSGNSAVVTTQAASAPLVLGPSLFRMASGAVQATGMFNVKSFGAIGDGLTHPLSGVSDFQGKHTTGWTLAQWQAVFPHATALTNELDWCAGQAALNAAKAAGGGKAYWPASSGYGYQHDQELVTSSVPAVGLLGDGSGSVLHWPVDLGDGKFAVRTENNAAPDTEVPIHHLNLQGSFDPPLGQRPRLQSGVLSSRNVNVRFCYVYGFNHGVQFVNNHSQVMYCQVEKNYFNLYWGAGGDTYGNQYVAFCGLTGATMASIGSHWDGTIDTCAFYSSHLGFAPYGIYKEAAPNGSTARGFLTNSTLVDISLEECGTGGIYDANTDQNVNISNNSFVNFNIAMTATEFVLPGVARPAAVYCGVFGGNTFIGAQSFIISSHAFPNVSVALIQTRGACFNNKLGNISAWLEDAPSYPAIGLIKAGADSPGNTWDNATVAGQFSQLIETADPLPAGTLMRGRFGVLYTGMYGSEDEHNILGVLASVGLNDYLVPIATSGTVQVAKTGSALFTGRRVYCAASNPGKIEEHNQNAVQPLIGVAAQDASAEDATIFVVLRIQQPLKSGYLPGVSGSRSGDTATILAAVLSALSANGILLDDTSA